jgi:hypothetical protein
MKRAVRAAAASPVPMAVEIAPDGTIRIVPAPEPQSALKLPTVARRKEMRL